MMMKLPSIPRAAFGLASMTIPSLFPIPAWTAEIIDLDPIYSLPYPIVEASTLEPTGRVDLVSAEILDAIQASDLTSALRRVPGVTISRYNPVGAFGGSDGGGIFIRGHGSGRPGSEISTMMDGVPLFVGVWTHPLIDTLSIDLAESIEVFKGPQPARLGNMGFGAVNIIPKTASLDGQHGELQASVGHFDTTFARAQVSHQRQNLGLLISASHRQSDGHRENADGETQAFYTNLQVTLNPQWTISLLASITDAWANDPEPLHTSLPITENYQTQNHFYLGKLNHSGDAFDFELKLHLEAGQGDWLQWHAAPPPPFPSQTLRSTTDYDNRGVQSRVFHETESFSWELGMHWDRFGGSLIESYAVSPSARFDTRYFELTSPHLLLTRNVELSSMGKLQLSGGFRYLMHSVFEAKPTGQLGLAYETGTSRIYTQWAQSVNYPGVYASIFGQRPPPWQVKEDWRQLDVESVQHFEVGFQHRILNPAVTIDLSLFHDEVENAIRFVTPPPAGYILNIGAYRIQGAELMLRYQRTNGSVFTGITWMHSNTDLPNAPEWNAIIGFHLKKGSYRLTTDFQHVSSQLTTNPRFSEALQSVASYQLLNAKLSYLTELPNVSIEYYLSGENLANQPYEYRPGYPMPGINLTFGAKLTW